MSVYDKRHELTVEIGTGLLSVWGGPVALTAGTAYVWGKAANAASWTLIDALPTDDVGEISIGAADLYRGGHVLLIFELDEDAEAGTSSSFKAAGELRLGGHPVKGSRVNVSGTFKTSMWIEAVDWTIQ